jgi:hypothetical protein
MEMEIHSKLKELTTEDERVKYLLDCLPFIKESIHTTETVNVESKSFKGMIIHRKQKKGDLYKRFIRKVYEGCEDCEYDGDMCSQCGSSNLMIFVQSSEQVCGNCAVIHSFDYDKTLGYKDDQEMETKVVYPYKRENHFNEWVCQFQAKEFTSVPQKIIDDIHVELKKQKITDKNDITHTKIKDILKKLGYNKYYEHIPYITTIVNGIKPPTMPQPLEDRLRHMFHQIQEPFDRHCPKERINFLSYSYVLYKFCELLGEDEYLPCFPLLKSKEKLYKHDQIWKKITADLRWQYIQTI